ncbi:hypothetical protein [Pseudomonas sp.]|uniref:hypothetical protein n=1 Tax=Pseudomonas sp. TaxID=306 RepID=UPI00258988C0|nr:hypothetical protein [Pseudomonas sp.]
MADMNVSSNEAMSSSDDYNAAPCIYLNDDQVEALGIKEPPKPGTVFMLKVKAVATRVTAEAEEADEQATEGNAPDVSLTLRLDDIEITGNGGLTQSAAATMLYGSQ